MEIPQISGGTSDGLLQGRSGVCLDDGLCWLRSASHLLAKHDSHTSLGGWFDLRLDHGNLWDGELGNSLHFSSGELCNVCEDCTDLLWLQLTGLAKSLHHQCLGPC